MSAPGRRVADRWPDGVAERYVALPLALLDHADALGLNDGHVRLLLALESFRRGDGSEAVYPSQATLAKRCGCSPKRVAARLLELRRAGLIEVDRRGRGNRYTRAGLDAALARLIASDRSDLGGVDQGHRSDSGGEHRSDLGAGYRPDLGAEEEAVEGEAEDARGARAIAAAIIKKFNGRAGTDFVLDDSAARPILERVLEHPDLSLADYEQLLGVAFVDPWWMGPPSPLVLFSAKQFERALKTRHARSPSRRDARPERSAEEREDWNKTARALGATFLIEDENGEECVEGTAVEDEDAIPPVRLVA
jgi:hypothetical protein